jgi:spore germination protein KA
LGFWQTLAKILTFQEPDQAQPFELLESVDDQPEGNKETAEQTADQKQPQITNTTQSNSGSTQDSQPAKTHAETGGSNQQNPNQPPPGPQKQDHDTQAASTSVRQPGPGYRLARRPTRAAKIGDPITVELVKIVSDQLKQKQAAGESRASSGDSKSGQKSTESPSSSKGDQPGSGSRSRRQHRQHRQSNQGTTSKQSNSINSENKNTSSNNKGNHSIKRASAPEGNKTTGPNSNDNTAQDLQVYADLEQNLFYIGEAFHWPTDTGLIVREFVVSTEPPTKAIVVYVEGLADPGRLAQSIFEPLMLMSELSSAQSGAPLLGLIKQRLLPVAAVKTREKFSDIIESVNSGAAALFIQGVSQALVIETSGWPRRGVEQAVSERVIRGPQNAFNEDLATNISLIRSILRDPLLIKEDITVGLRARNKCALLYIQDLVNPNLVKEIKRRINSLRVDTVLSTGALEQYIEDNSWGIYPLSMATERPDRAAATLLDGKVVVLLEGDPFALVFPSSLWSLMQTAEDHSIRGLGATMLKAVRLMAALILLFLPGLYMAIVGFHQEMIPTDLLLSIAANRERVPFPSVVEVILMELAFELIREAGVRIPGIIGPTLGIVGGIILGQAAVAANLVNPIVIIVVAITGISSFSIPSYSLSIALRLYRFAYVFLGATMGLFGIAVGVVLHITVISNLRSMGMPYLAPVTPFTRGNKDILVQGMIWKQERRLDAPSAQDRYRQAPIARQWILNPDNQEGEKGQ